MNNSLSTAALRRLIGQPVHYDGLPCQVIELLEDGPALVLRGTDRHAEVQEDQYGNPSRLVSATFTVPIYSAGTELHPEFLALRFDCLCTTAPEPSLIPPSGPTR